MNSPSSEIKKFENEHLIAEVTVQPGCQVKVTVQANGDFSQKTYKEALQRVKKEVSIPGFRKGKAPDTLLISHYSKAIDQEWKDAALNLAFRETLQLMPYAPVKASAKDIRSHLHHLSKESCHITYEFESIPETPLIEPSLIQIPEIPLQEIQEKDIEEKIQESQLALATWEEVLDRPAQHEDFVNLNLAEIREGTEIPDFTNQRFHIVDKKMAPWLQKLVIGLKPGESKEGMSEPSEALVNDEKDSFKPALFKVTLNKIETPSLPERDDAFAERLGVKSMQDVHEAIKKQLEFKAKAEQKNKQIEAVQEALVSLYSFDLPKSLVEKRHQEILSQLKQQLERAKVSEDELKEKSAKIDQEALKEAQTKLSLYYLFRKYNDQHHISVTNDDLNFELNQILRHFPKEMLSQIAQSLGDEFYSQLIAEISVKKGIHHLVDHLISS